MEIARLDSKTNGCISYAELRVDEKNRRKLIDETSTGEEVIDLYSLFGERQYFKNNNEIPIILNGVKYAITQYYLARNITLSADEINEKIDQNRKRIFEMILFDCLFGNNDRHDENWSMVSLGNGEGCMVYPLYDNERILAMCENIEYVKTIQNEEDIKKYSDECFSRMVPKGYWGKSGKNGAPYLETIRYLLDEYKDEVMPILKRMLNEFTIDDLQEILDNCDDGLDEYHKKVAKGFFIIRQKEIRDLILEIENEREN